MFPERVTYSSFVFARQRFGGISRMFVEIAERLVGVGIEVDVIAPVYRSELLRSTGWGGLRLPTALDGRGGGAFAEVAGRVSERAAARRLRKDRSAVWHATYLTAPNPLGVPLVVTAFDMIHDENPDEFVDAAEVLARKRALYTRADAIIAISHDTRERLLERYPVRPESVHVAPLGVDHERFTPGFTAERVSPGPLLYVGDRDGYKNFSVLAEAVASSAELRQRGIRCFGGGPPSSAERLMLSEMGLEECVTFIAGTDDDLAEEYRRATAYVCPSRSEGFGLPVLEAMACGCPVVTTTGGALVEVGGDAAVQVAPDDSDALAQGLLDVVVDEGLRRRLRTKGISRAGLFSWSRTADGVLSAYRTLG